MKKLRVLDLFSGIGGFSLGLERTGGFETVAFCEIEEFPRKVLAKHWPKVPIYRDVRTLDATGLGRIDCIVGGYPCQPFSHAGKRLGAEDDRHLWPEMRRLVEALRPAWVIGENVAGHVSMGLDDVLSDLDGLGYAAQAFVIPACAVNAPHRRDRVWIVAHAVSERSAVGAASFGYERAVCDGDGHGESAATERDELQSGPCGDVVVAHAPYMQRDGGNDHAAKRMGREQVSQSGNGGGEKDVADTIGSRQSGPWASRFTSHPEEDGEGEAVDVVNGGIGSVWGVEPAVGRVAHGVPHRVDRLKALGNAVVPQIPELIGRAILQSIREAA